MSNEKRRTPRLDAHLFAELAFLPSREPLGRAIVSDVSVSGVAVDTEAEFEVGDKVECRMEIPIVIQAKVVRVVPHGQVKRYGLMFVNQSFFDKIVLKKILKGPRKTRRVSL